MNNLAAELVVDAVVEEEEEESGFCDVVVVVVVVVVSGVRLTRKRFPFDVLSLVSALTRARC
jgi:hypothetical protein